MAIILAFVIQKQDVQEFKANLSYNRLDKGILPGDRSFPFITKSVSRTDIKISRG